MKKFVTSVFAVAALAGIASARPLFHYEFPIDGLQEVPAVATPATGFGIVDLDSDTNMLSWTITWSGLIAPATAAHFHAPAAPGANAGVALAIPGFAGLSSGMVVGSALISDLFESRIIDGLSYVNIHTSFRPGGEIRGQVVPTPGALALVGLGGLVAVRRRRA